MKKGKEMKTFLTHIRKSCKLVVLIIIAFLLIFGIMYFLFRPMYAVRLNGQIIGYTDAKKQLEEKIGDYVKAGDGENIAFVEIDELPEYEVIYSKKDIEANEDEVFDTVIATGTPYYKNYAIMESGEEKMYVETFEEAEKVIADLKAKKSKNANSITYVVKYSSEKIENSKVDQVVSKLYEKPEPKKSQKTTKTTSKKSSSSTKYYTPTGSVNTSQKVSFAKASLGVSLSRPVSGTITSRFGRRSRGMHTGLDIANSTGTTIRAAAAGKITFAGRKGSYGNMVVVTHANGIQTYYCHCSKLNVTAGDTVSQGQKIAEVGSTGNSTGPHLHLEVRKNGICYNPQNYLY